MDDASRSVVGRGFPWLAAEAAAGSHTAAQAHDEKEQSRMDFFDNLFDYLTPGAFLYIDLLGLDGQFGRVPPFVRARPVSRIETPTRAM